MNDSSESRVASSESSEESQEVLNLHDSSNTDTAHQDVDYKTLHFLVKVASRTKSLRVSGINKEMGVWLSQNLRHTPITQFNISHLYGSKQWIIDLINSCHTLQSIEIKSHFSLKDLILLLSAINEHPNLVSVIISGIFLNEYLTKYDDIWDEFAKYNQSLLYAKFMGHISDRNHILQKMLYRKDGEIGIVPDAKLSFVHFNWLHLKYPDERFWQDELNNSFAEIGSKFIAGLNKSRIEIPQEIIEKIVGMLDAQFKIDCLRLVIGTPDHRPYYSNIMLRINNHSALSDKFLLVDTAQAVPPSLPKFTCTNKMIIISAIIISLYTAYMLAVGLSKLPSTEQSIAIILPLPITIAMGIGICIINRCAPTPPAPTEKSVITA